MKQISAALLLKTPEGFLFAHPTGKSFYPGNWDLPKGRIEENELPYDAMTRELKEETSLDFKLNIEPEAKSMLSLGLYPYTKAKNLFIFYCEIDKIFPLEDLTCTSTYLNSFGKEIPEHNGYIYSFNLSLLYPKLEITIKKALTKFNLL